ncbi:copper chaperone PCu(A)C [Streptacidiphilus sp. P02-A3a]|uniref:copper chaperone PCu(A)C n=1 Tax=Streptacidiphilus sp. P02-A3a TaxID=2704468 RepID=UPI0015FE0C13|nr:copper chaperone PCu(A)C [Streptacidiphilus sp. P02-A3a]QMU69004.1 copper chaperone PCu(A)C [Streptacidiphilus sp. P02-A3a]
MRDDRDSVPEPDEAAREALELAALEQEAAELEARSARRGGLLGARRLLVLQAPVLIALAVVLLLWSRGTPVSAAATAATSSAAAPAKVGMVNAYLAPASGGEVRGYMVIKNNGDSADRLVSITSPWASTITLNEGTSSTALPWITVPAHGTVTLKPGGYSFVMSDLARTPKLGDTIALTVSFADSGTVYVFAPEGPASSLTVQKVMNNMQYMHKLPPQ